VPAREPLNRDRVLRAALSLADEAGVDALTMRRLAKELGVEAMSLYNHVPGKDALLNGLVNLVFEEIEPPSPEDEWRDAMRKRALSTRAALRRHPWAVGLMEGGSTPGPANARLHEAVLACLRGAGFSLAETVHAYNVQDSYIYGFALQERALPEAFEDPEVSAQVAARQLAQIPPDEFPFVREMVGGHIAEHGFDYAAEFVFGLDLILEGLERRRQGQLAPVPQARS
jgi:AcrR family transcriptional regulator